LSECKSLCSLAYSKATLTKMAGADINEVYQELTKPKIDTDDLYNITFTKDVGNNQITIRLIPQSNSKCPYAEGPWVLPE